MVHGRERDDEIDQFGVSGYVYKNVFLMFDRKTESLWYPLTHDAWTAVAGPRRGEKIPLVEKDVVKLGDWRRKHPKTTVLLGSKSKLEKKDGA